MTDFVPASQGTLLGAVPALPGGAGTLEGLASARPKSAVSFVLAQSFAPWKPPPEDDHWKPCAHPTKKGGVCGMARAYSPSDPTHLTDYCQTHWRSIFAACNQGLLALNAVMASPPPD